MASDIFRSFVQRWLLQGSLEEAKAEDLAHLSNSAVKLNILEEKKSDGLLHCFFLLEVCKELVNR